MEPAAEAGGFLRESGMAELERTVTFQGAPNPPIVQWCGGA
jgi:hypothetical protein